MGLRRRSFDADSTDTSTQCVTVMQQKWLWRWVIVKCWDVVNWVWPGYAPIGHGSATLSGGNVSVVASTAGDGVSFTLPVAVGVKQSFSIEFGALSSAGAGTAVRVQELRAGKWVALASVEPRRGLVEVEFTPTASSVQLVFAGPMTAVVSKACIAKWDLVQDQVLVDICDWDKDRYRFGFNGQEKVNEIAGIGNHNTAEFWEYDTRTGRRWNIDPKTSMKPDQSSFSTFSGNPIWFNDVLGDLESTHTDEKGKVIDVKNDGNLGIYKHSDKEIADFNAGTSDLKIEPGKEVGNTLYENSFSKGDKIDFGSYRARDWINNFENGIRQTSGPSFLRKAAYAINAKQKGLFDPKSYLSGGVNGGSQISSGVYISNRDIGNYAAGAFGRIINWNKKEMMVDYGAFQLSKGFNDYRNNRQNLSIKAANFKDIINEIYADPTQKTYGEEPRSNWFQRLGYENINTLPKFNQNYNKILNDGE